MCDNVQVVPSYLFGPYRLVSLSHCPTPPVSIDHLNIMSTDDVTNGISPRSAEAASWPASPKRPANEIK
jgi:hypothetical protein